MFVEVNNDSLSVIDIDKTAKRKRENEGGFSPSLACWVLSKTNHMANIKWVIMNIKAVSQDKWIEYKDFVLSCVDGREQSLQALKELREFARLGGYEDEFNKADEKEKIYAKNVCKSICVSSVKELKEAIDNGVFVHKANISNGFFNVDLSHLDLRGVYKLDVDTDSTCDLSNCMLPYRMNIKASEINFDNSSFYKVQKVNCVGHKIKGLVLKLSETVNLTAMDLSNAKEICMMICDLSNFDELKFMDGAYVDLGWSYNFPKVVDVSNARVVLSRCDFARVEKIIFGKDADLHGAKNLPKTLDFSNCEMVILSECDLEQTDKIIFGSCNSVNMCEAKNLCKVIDVSNCNQAFFSKTDFAGVEKFEAPRELISLIKAVNLPKTLDLRNCDEVHCEGTDLTGLKEIKFKKGASVYLQNAYNLPEKLDFSMCDTVYLRDCDFSGVKEVKFRDEAQMEYCMDMVLNFNGKFVYDKVKQMKKNVRSTVINVMDKLYEVE